MKVSIQAGKTSQSVNIFIQDSSSTTGAGLAGLVYNSAGLTAYYTFAGTNATATAITLATLAAVNSAYSSGGFKEIDATNMPGWYRFDPPDAVLAAAKGRSVAMHLKGATNMAPLPIEIELTGWDNQDAVRGGLTALPNANAEAAGGLYTRGTGAGQINQQANGQVDANLERWINVAPLALSSQRVQVLVGAVTNGVIAAASFAANALDAVWSTAARTLTAATNITSTGGTTVPQTGDSFARIGATGAGLTTLATQASVDTIDDFLDTEVAAILAAVDTEVGAIKTKTDSLTFTVAGQVDANTLSINGSAAAAARLALASANMLPGTVDSTAFPPTVTEFESDDIAIATTDRLKGRIIVFTSGARQYEATTITGYSVSGGRGHFTVTALTAAPADNVTFIII